MPEDNSLPKKKVVDGEVVESLVPVTPRPLVKSQRSMTPAEQETAERLLQHIDVSDIEHRLFDSYAGSFVGLCYDPDDQPVVPEKKDRLIVLTDEDDHEV